MDWSGKVGVEKIFIKTLGPVKHEIAPSFFPSHRGKMLLTTPDKKIERKKEGLGKPVFWSCFKSVQISSSFPLMMHRNFRDTADMYAAVGQAMGTETQL